MKETREAHVDNELGLTQKVKACFHVMKAGTSTDIVDLTENEPSAISLLQSEGLHTLEGLFCFLDFRRDLCFEPPDFVFFKGKRQKEKKALATEGRMEEDTTAWHEKVSRHKERDMEECRGQEEGKRSDTSS